MNLEEALARLQALANPTHLEGMAGFGIETARAYGISAPKLYALAREIGRDHALAEALWASGQHEARILAAMVDEPRAVTEEQMERWVRDLDSWDVCDNVCGNLFDRQGDLSYRKAAEWAEREGEFVKRAGFALMAYLAVHDKKAPDDRFEAFLPLIKREAGDRRNFVKKAVNWALRQIGKRNRRLNARAIEAAQEILAAFPRGNFVASDALRELRSEAVQRRLKG